jgi:nucleoside-diphosphate-sugar epimerase
MKQVGITGAFGFLGSNFIAALQKGTTRGLSFWRDVRIIAFAHGSSCAHLFSESGIEIRHVDILDYQDLVRNFDSLDYIVHFAGARDAPAMPPRRMWDINVMGTKNVLDAALARGIGHVLFSSSLCVLGEQAEGSAPLTESSRPYGDPHFPISFGSPIEALENARYADEVSPSIFRTARSIYCDSKIISHELVAQYAKERGSRVSIVIPGIVVGSGDTPFSERGGHCTVRDRSPRQTRGGGSSFVCARDFAEGALSVIERGRPGEEYVLSGRDDQNLQYGDFIELARKCGYPQASWGLRWPTLLRSDRGTSYCSSAKARRELGYAPSGSLSDALRESRDYSERIRSLTIEHDLSKYGLDFSSDIRI